MESAIWALRHYLLAAPAPAAATVKTKLHELELKAKQAAPPDTAPTPTGTPPVLQR